MKWEWLLYFTILPLLIASFAGCSNDEEETEDPFSDRVIETSRGKVVIREIEEYPDSAWFSQYLLKIPCRPIPRSSLPLWLYDELVLQSISVSGYAYQGEYKESGESVYEIRNFLFNRFSSVFDSKGNSLRISSLSDEENLVASTINWRCIHILKAYPLNN